jgi:hypothetical protein
MSCREIALKDTFNPEAVLEGCFEEVCDNGSACMERCNYTHMATGS